MSQSKNVNSDWFHNKLKDSNKSLRGLARHLQIDPSAASRMFSGERRMKMEEASQIALFLGVPVSEVHKHAGVTAALSGYETQILLAAIINENGMVEGIHEPTPLPPAIIEKALLAVGLGNGRVIAAQVRASAGPLSIWDDAVILFNHTDTVEPTAIGTLSICRTRDGKQFLAKVDRARKTGEARIVSPGGKIEEAMLSTATPVLAVIP